MSDFCVTQICARCKQEKLCSFEPTFGTMLFGPRGGYSYSLGTHSVPRMEYRCEQCDKVLGDKILATLDREDMESNAA